MGRGGGEEGKVGVGGGLEGEGGRQVKEEIKKKKWTPRGNGSKAMRESAPSASYCPQERGVPFRRVKSLD